MKTKFKKKFFFFQKGKVTKKIAFDIKKGELNLVHGGHFHLIFHTQMMFNKLHEVMKHDCFTDDHPDC